MLRIAVCDDLAEERARLLAMLREYCAAAGLSAAYVEYDSGEALLQARTPGAFSLVFMDIYMEQMSGLETARLLKATDPDCEIVFTTSSREHGADAFDVEAFHYLVKPYSKEKLFSVMNKWYNACCAIRAVTLKCGRAEQVLLIKDILYIDVMGHVSVVHTSAGTCNSSMSLSAIEALLPEEDFARPIRYCLVALMHIKLIRDDDILLDNGETIALSRREKENLRKRLASYRLRTLRRR